MSAPRARRLRLMPTVMIAAGLLLGLKAVELAAETGSMFSTPAVAAGSAQDDEPKAEAAPAPAGDRGPAKAGRISTVRPDENPVRDSRGELAQEPSSEGALIDALTRRREAIDARAAELDQRETLIKAAEKRMEDRLAELKRIERSIAEADTRRAEQESGKLKELVVMYETMKPKEAARIFEKLDAAVLLEVASRMKSRQLSVVLGLMEPEAARKLTVSLATRQVAPEASETIEAAELPKIQGRPTPR